MLGKTSISDLSEHVFDLILELYNIDSHLLLSVLPQLEFKLKVIIIKIIWSVSQINKEHYLWLFNSYSGFNRVLQLWWYITVTYLHVCAFLFVCL